MGSEIKSPTKHRISAVKLISVCLFIIIILSFALIYSLKSGIFPWGSNVSVSPYPDGAEVHFIDIGQGDSTLIRTADGCILIDAGPNSAENTLKSYLDSLDIKNIRYCIFTHPDEDHIGGGDMIMKEYDVDNVLVPDVSSDSPSYDRLMCSVSDSGAELIYACAGQSFSVGNVTFTVLSPDETPTDNANNSSVVVIVRIGDVSFMLQGDAETEVEDRIIRTFPEDVLRCNVLKAGHHGSSTSTGEKWLDAIAPDYAVISCGNGNTYGHPHLLTLTRLQKHGTEVFRTDENGSVVFYTDGKEITVKCKNAK